MTSPTSLTAGNILAIDTSGPSGSLALQGEEVHWNKKAVHSEIATVKLEELLEKTNLDLSDLSAIMVNAGPGSFTGIRVGINLARTLSYSLKIPICSLNSLELLAFARAKVPCLVAIKAIQNFYYVAGFDRTAKGLVQRLAPHSVADSELPALGRDFQEILIEGHTPDFSPQLDAVIQLQWLAQWPDSTTFSTWNEVRPVYIRASEAEEKLLKGLLKA